MTKLLKGLFAAVLLVGCGAASEMDSPDEIGSREDAINVCAVGAAPYSTCNGGNGVCVYPTRTSRNADCRPKCGVVCGTTAPECCVGIGPMDFCSMNRGCFSAQPHL
jgi:hypothetical protein